MTINGTIERVCNPQTGNKQDGTQWVRQDFVVVLDGGGNYPDRVLVTAFGERVSDVQRLTIGQHVTALVDFKVSDWNGKFYNNINLYKFEQGQAQPQPAPQQNVAPAATVLPPQPAQQPAPNDELPF